MPVTADGPVGGRARPPLVARNRYAILVTCGPPHMVHWAGQRVAAEAGIPFVMDLRDPWSLVERLADVFASPVWYGQARHFEQRAVAGAEPAS